MSKNLNDLIQKLDYWKNKFGSHFIIEIDWYNAMSCYIVTNDILVPAADALEIVDEVYDPSEQSFYDFVEEQLDKIYIWYCKYHILIDAFMIHWDKFTLTELISAMERDKKKE